MDVSIERLLADFRWQSIDFVDALPVAATSAATAFVQRGEKKREGVETIYSCTPHAVHSASVPMGSQGSSSTGAWSASAAKSPRYSFSTAAWNTYWSNQESEQM